MTTEEIATLFSEEGLYVLEDSRCPGCTCAVMVLNDMKEQNEQGHRRAFMLTTNPDSELSLDPSRWQQQTTTRLIGGPFSVAVCNQLEKDGQRLFELETAVAETKEYVRMYRDVLLSKGMTGIAEAMQIVLDTLTPEAK